MKRVLLDECVPRKFGQYLPGVDCVTAPDAGFAGKKNGELLTLAENAGFQIFVTVDQGIEYQLNLAGRNIVIIVVKAATNRLIDLLPFAKTVEAAAISAASGQIVRIP